MWRWRDWRERRRVWDDRGPSSCIALHIFSIIVIAVQDSGPQIGREVRRVLRNCALVPQGYEERRLLSWIGDVCNLRSGRKATTTLGKVQDGERRKTNHQQQRRRRKSQTCTPYEREVCTNKVKLKDRGPMKRSEDRVTLLVQ